MKIKVTRKKWWFVGNRWWPVNFYLNNQCTGKTPSLKLIKRGK